MAGAMYRECGEVLDAGLARRQGMVMVTLHLVCWPSGELDCFAGCCLELSQSSRMPHCRSDSPSESGCKYTSELSLNVMAPTLEAFPGPSLRSTSQSTESRALGGSTWTVKTCTWGATFKQAYQQALEMQNNEHSQPLETCYNVPMFMIEADHAHLFQR
jgi:hypothetical protein